MRRRLAGEVFTIDSEPEVACMLADMMDAWEADMEQNVRGWL